MTTIPTTRPPLVAQANDPVIRFPIGSNLPVPPTNSVMWGVADERTAIRDLEIKLVMRGAQALNDGRVRKSERQSILDAVIAARQITANVRAAIDVDLTGHNRHYMFEGEGKPRAALARGALLEFERQLSAYAATEDGRNSFSVIYEAREQVRDALKLIPESVTPRGGWQRG